jgi:uncharacterized phage protein gp47/JayE
MTFVALPHEQLADDLLTGLTGGVAREEHRFLGAKLPYVLESPDARIESVRVTGQVKSAHIAFQRDVDFVVTGNGAIMWRDVEDARLPDENSFFYVSYYRDETPRRLTDRNPGSVTWTLAHAFGRELAVLQKQMQMIYESAFVDLATSTSLDHVGALLALTRRDARFAIGEVTFRRGTPAPGDIAIPAGTLVSTARGDNFETTDERVLRRGQLAVSVPVRAQVDGPTGLVEASTIGVVNRPIFGIDAVVNEEGTYFASERETDEAFRRRIRGTLERAGRSTIEAIRQTLIERVPGVTDANVQVAERANAAGVVDVKLGLTTVTEEVVRRVDDAIFASRPAGVRVTHNLPRRPTLPGTIQLPAGTLATRGTASELGVDVLNRFPEGLLPLQVVAAVRLAQPALAVGEQQSIKDEIRTRVVNYFTALPMGTDVVYSKLVACVVGADDVADARVAFGPAGTAPPTLRENLATSGRKASVEPIAVDVSLMLESVTMDVLVLVTKGPIANAYQSAASNALLALLATPRLAIRQEEMLAAVKAAWSSPVADVPQGSATPELVDGSDAIVINARYADTGRVLTRTTEVVFAENHLPSLGNVTVRAVGDV